LEFAGFNILTGETPKLLPELGPAKAFGFIIIGGAPYGFEVGGTRYALLFGD
jgi:hypothetical protein